MSAFAIRMAYKCATKLVDLSRPVWELFEALRAHNLAPEVAARVRELLDMRERLRLCLEEAKTKLEPQLEEFACVHDAPVEINGFVVPSAHKAALKLGEWAAGPGHAHDRAKAFLDRYYDAGKRQLDWQAARKQNEGILRSFTENDYHEEWAEHRAMLEIELAKALRLPPIKRAEVKLSAKEQQIVTGLGDETLRYKELAARAGCKANSEFRKKLAEMARRGLLEGGEEGYSLGRLLS